MDLVICRTPFQAYLAGKIIRQNAVQDFEVLYISPAMTMVHVNYFNRLSEAAADSNFLIAHEDLSAGGKIIENVYLSYMIRKKFKKRNYNNIIISSIDSTLIQTLISIASYKYIVSYDDGSANYNYNGGYYKKNEEHIARRLIGKCFGNRMTKAKLILEVKEHYAIDCSRRNIVDNVMPLDLDFIERASWSSRNTESTCRVLIGTVYDKVSSEPHALVSRVKEKLKNINYYIPHPRYKTDPVNIFNSLDDPLICEEKILLLLKRYEAVNIFTFGSTALLTLSAMPGVRLILIRSQLINEWAYVDEMEAVVDEVVWI